MDRSEDDRKAVIDTGDFTSGGNSGSSSYFPFASTSILYKKTSTRQ